MEPRPGGPHSALAAAHLFPLLRCTAHPCRCIVKLYQNITIQAWPSTPKFSRQAVGISHSVDNPHRRPGRTLQGHLAPARPGVALRRFPTTGPQRLAGVALAFGLALMLRRFTPFPADPEWWVALLGVLLATAIALILGVYPAIRASRMDPAEALRSD